jgi:hypothetical protein
MTYAFTVDNPPLLKDLGAAVLTLPSSALSETPREASWQSVYHADGNYTIYVIAFTLTRTKYWQISDPLTHFAEDNHFQRKVLTGYTRTEKQSFMQNLGADVNGSLFGALKFDIKASLQITQDTEQEWKQEDTETHDVTFKAGTSYITWKLIDGLHLHKVTTITGTGWATHVVEDRSTDLNDILETYEDSLSTETLPKGDIP